MALFTEDEQLSRYLTAEADDEEDEFSGDEASSPWHLDGELKYLNSQLTMLGLPTPLIMGPGTSTDEHRRSVEVIKEVVKKIADSATDKENVLTRANKMRTENERLLGRLKRSESAAEEAACDAKQVRDLLDSHRLESRGMRTNIANERDDWRKQVHTLTQRETRYQSELKKKDRELAVLKARLHQALDASAGNGVKDSFADRKKQRQARIDLSEPLTAAPASDRSAWKTSEDGESEFDDMIRRTYEGRLREAVCENRGLRTALRELTARFDAALEARGNSAVAGELKDGVFELPYELCTGSLTTEFEHRVEALQYYSDHVESAAGGLTLKEELAEQKKLVREQQKLLTEAAGSKGAQVA